jgi:hypothetical protein
MPLTASRTPVPVLFVSLLLPTLCFSQKPPASGVDRTFHLTNAPDARGFQELATILRTVGQIRSLAIDVSSSAISVTGTPAEIEIAEWTIHAFDRPAVPEQLINDTSVQEYRAPGAKDDLVRMFYLANVDTPQSMQEILTVLRTVGAIRYIFNYTPLHALAVRGTTDEIALAAWAIHELDQQPTAEKEGIHQFKSSDSRYPVVRALYPAHHAPDDIQDAVKILRTQQHIPRVFYHTARGALILAGSADQMEQAAQLIAAKDHPVTP